MGIFAEIAAFALQNQIDNIRESAMKNLNYTSGLSIHSRALYCVVKNCESFNF